MNLIYACDNELLYGYGDSACWHGEAGASHNACLHIDSLSFDVRLYF